MEETKQDEKPKEEEQRYEDEVEINDFPQTARWKVTSKVHVNLGSNLTFSFRLQLATGGKNPVAKTKISGCQFMTSGSMAAETIKLILIWLHCPHALLCIAFIADLILILLLSGFYRWFCGAERQICFIQSEAPPRSGQWHVISMEFLHPFFRRHFAGKSLVASRNVGCFLRLYYSLLSVVDPGEGSGGPAPPLIFD